MKLADFLVVGLYLSECFSDIIARQSVRNLINIQLCNEEI